MVSAVDLLRVRRGTHCQVHSVAVGEDRVLRLAELGIRVGANVQPLHRTSGGGRVVSVAGSRIALDSDTAQQIQVVVHE